MPKKKAEPPRIIVEANDDFFGAVLNCAVRYALGRRTYMPGLVMEQIRKWLPLLSEKTLWCFEQDIARAQRDEALGDPNIDAPGWMRFLSEVQEERAKRRGRDEHIADVLLRGARDERHE